MAAEEIKVKRLGAGERVVGFGINAIILAVVLLQLLSIYARAVDWRPGYENVFLRIVLPLIQEVYYYAGAAVVFASSIYVMYHFAKLYITGRDDGHNQEAEKRISEATKDMLIHVSIFAFLVLIIGVQVLIFYAKRKGDCGWLLP